MLEKILELFYSQEVFKEYPRPQVTAYFKSIIDNGQIVTVEKEGKIIAFQDYWIINRRIRDLMLRMTREQAIIFGIWGCYPHCPGGKHLHINFTVVHKDYRDKFLTVELARKIYQKNPDAKTVIYYRLNNKAYLSEVRK